MSNRIAVEAALEEGKRIAAVEIAERIKKARETSEANAYGAEIIARNYAAEHTPYGA